MSENLNGHAIHFLERLPRADAESAELALELYHEPKILRWVLGRIRIPENRERLALSLAPEDRGPFLVATREGAFVTCLGRDMTATELHLVPHGQLLAHRRDWYDARDKLRLQNEIKEKDRRFEDFLGGVIRKGLLVSREEFTAASALQPVLKHHYGRRLADVLCLIAELEDVMTITKHLERQPSKRLRMYWEEFWLMGHLVLLTSMDGRRDFSDAAVDVLAECDLNLFRFGERPLLMRALWAVARLGRVGLGPCRERLAHSATTDMDWLAGLLGVAVLGLRYERLREEARRTFASLPEYRGHHVKAARFAGHLGPKLCEILLSIFDKTDEWEADHLTYARELTFRIARAVEAESPFDFAEPVAVPDTLALGFCATWEMDVRGSTDGLITLMSALPWLARCAPEDLYPPSAWYEAVPVKWVPRDTLRLIENTKKFWGKPRTARVEAMPGRNDPCPCGSGKKYKKCCLGASA